jgi:hypothetical protein
MTFNNKKIARLQAGFFMPVKGQKKKRPLRVAKQEEINELRPKVDV